MSILLFWFFLFFLSLRLTCISSQFLEGKPCLDQGNDILCERSSKEKGAHECVNLERVILVLKLVLIVGIYVMYGFYTVLKCNISAKAAVILYVQSTCIAV